MAPLQPFDKTEQALLVFNLKIKYAEDSVDVCLAQRCKLMDLKRIHLHNLTSEIHIFRSRSEIGTEQVGFTELFVRYANLQTNTLLTLSRISNEINFTENHKRKIQTIYDFTNSSNHRLSDAMLLCVRGRDKRIDMIGWGWASHSFKSTQNNYFI